MPPIPPPPFIAPVIDDIESTFFNELTEPWRLRKDPEPPPPPAPPRGSFRPC